MAATKSGFLTSEFYLALAPLLVTVLGVGFGLTAEQQQEAGGHLAGTITAAAGLLAFAATAWRYVASREKLKLQDNEFVEDDESDEEEEDEEEDEDDGDE